MSEPDQLPLVFRAANPDRVAAARAREQAEEAALVRLLESFGPKWAPRSELALRLGWSKHHVRRVAADCPHVVARIGVEGYKHLAHCTSEEYHHSRAARLSQCDKMKAKIVAQDALFFARKSAAA